MSISAFQETPRFHIRQRNFDPALEALKALTTRRIKEHGYLGGMPVQPILDARSLIEALSATVWQAVSDEQGDIVNLHFLSDAYSIDDELLMETLAPFVEPGSFIEMISTEAFDQRWRWVFDGKTVQTRFCFCVSLDPEVEKELFSRAERLGISAAEYLPELLKESFASDSFWETH